VIEHHLDIPSADGAMNSFVVHPEEGGPHPFPERIRCIASIHGANMATDQHDSPHRMAPRTRCESYFACAEVDKWAPPADIRKLQASLEAAGTPHTVEWYPGVEHGFVFPLRTGIYDRIAAERHWERLFSLFDRNLRQARR